MSNHDSHASHGSHGSQTKHLGHFLIPMPWLMMNLGALTILMVLTIAAAQMHFGPLLNWVILLGIAFIKSTLVVQIFMGVKFSSKLTKLYAYGGFIWLILIFGLFIDYFTRPYEQVPGWETTKESALPR